MSPHGLFGGGWVSAQLSHMFSKMTHMVADQAVVVETIAANMDEACVWHGSCFLGAVRCACTV